jgi:pantoate--beta-alanine ligase
MKRATKQNSNQKSSPVMQVTRSPKKMQEICGGLKRRGKTIGLVPTMGYLHEGHLSLVRTAKKKSDVVMVSVFVNPTQFGPKEDFARYPRDFKRDRFLLEQEGCDFLFVPQVKDMYPEGHLTYVDVREITTRLEGTARPGHFCGVTTVVAKLFNIVQPDLAVFGQKDAQQSVVLRKMVDDLNYGIRIIVAPTVREKNGLALSSRNKYLSPEEHRQAAVLYQSLRQARKLIASGERNADRIAAVMRDLIRERSSARLDYIAVTDAHSLQRVKRLTGEVLISLAARFGRTRLIDNIKVRVS